MAVIVLFPKTLVLFESFVTNQPFFKKVERWLVMYKGHMIKNAMDCIMDGFTWEDTKQGQKFWNNVHDALDELYENGGYDGVCDHAFKCVKCGEVVDKVSCDGC